MSLLRARSNAALAQEIRSRLRARSSPASPVVIFEGTTDVAVYKHFLTDDPSLHAVGGRDRVLFLFEDFRGSPEASDLLFLVDCDGGLEARFKGHPNLVISVHRDIECDLVLRLAALDRLLIEEPALPPSMVGLAVNTAVMVGQVKDSARGLGLPVRKREAGYSSRMRVPMRELSGALPVALPLTMEDLERLVRRYAGVVGWDAVEAQAVENAAGSIHSRECVQHHEACDCAARQYCNGHDLFEILHQQVVAAGVGYESEHEFEKVLRMGASDLLAREWAVVERIRRYERLTGAKVLASRLR